MDKKITKKLVLEMMEKYRNRVKVAKALKTTEWEIRKLLGITGRNSNQNKSGDNQVARPAVRTVRRRNLISEDVLLQSTDAETRITVALREEAGRLGPGQYMKDQDMRKECHAGDLMLWRDIREQEEFWPFAMMVGRTSDPMIYWGNPASIKALIQRGKAKSPSWRTV